MANADYLKQFPEKQRNKLISLINAIESRTPYKVIITDGVRTFTEQKKLYAQNPKNAKPGTSKHEKKNAIDLNLTLNGLVVFRKSTPKSEWEKTGVPGIARSMGFRWGGDFKTYHDPVHFEISDVFTDISEAVGSATEYVTKNPSILLVLVLIAVTIAASLYFTQTI